MSSNEAATYCDIAFETAQQALASGNLDEFKRYAEYHRAYAELFYHVKQGGRIH